MDKAWRDMTRRTVFGTAAMTGAAAVLRTADAQQAPAPDPSKPFYSAAAASLRVAPFLGCNPRPVGALHPQWLVRQGKEIVLIHGVRQS